MIRDSLIKLPRIRVAKVIQDYNLLVEFSDGDIQKCIINQSW